MARLEDIERRLQNWARWKHGAGSGGLGYGSTWNTEASSTRYREAVIPTIDCEASMTDAAVCSLEQRLRQTIEQVYLTGDSAAIDAHVLGITVDAVKRRVWDAHRRINSWLMDRKALAEAERGRIETITRASKA